jgi:archaetidylinositol phosphate synthase
MSHNTWIHRSVRAGVRWLAPTGVTPNQLTTLRLATGFAAAFAFAQGTRSAELWGSAIFVVSLFLDRADGELARSTGQTSPWGHRYDLVSDSVSNAAAFIGIGVGAAAALGWLGPVLGILAGLSIVAILAMVMGAEAANGPRAAELQGAAGFDPDDAMLAVPVAMALGFGDILVIAAGIGAPLFAVFMALVVYRKLAAVRREG